MIRTALFALAAAACLAAPGSAFAQKYVGVDKCKTCHESKDMGQQITKWKASPHGKAWGTLAGDEAKKIAKGDAQKEAKCVKCHDTAAEAPADKVAASFKKGQGVGCESCHGPGEKHIKARMAAEEDAPVVIGADEIVAAPGEKVCTGCHNKESPTFKPFKYAEAVKAIAHPNPSRKAPKK